MSKCPYNGTEISRFNFCGLKFSKQKLFISDISFNIMF